MIDKLQDYFDYNKMYNPDEDPTKLFQKYVGTEYVTPTVQTPEVKLTTLFDSPLIKPTVKAPVTKTEVKKEIPQTTVEQPVNNTVIKGTVKDIINKYRKDAEDVARETGVPVSTILSQIIVEGGHNLNSDMRRANALFSIQSKTGKTISAKDKHADNSVYDATFQAYNTSKESMKGWVDFLTKNSYYKDVMANKSNPTAFLTKLAESPYAEGIGATKEERIAKKKKLYLDVHKQVEQALKNS